MKKILVKEIKVFAIGNELALHGFNVILFLNGIIILEIFVYYMLLKVILINVFRCVL